MTLADKIAMERENRIFSSDKGELKGRLGEKSLKRVIVMEDDDEDEKPKSRKSAKVDQRECKKDPKKSVISIIKDVDNLLSNSDILTSPAEEEKSQECPMKQLEDLLNES